MCFKNVFFFAPQNVQPFHPYQGFYGFQHYCQNRLFLGNISGLNSGYFKSVVSGRAQSVMNSNIFSIILLVKYKNRQISDY